MGSPLSEDLRVRVIQAVEEGASRPQAAERFEVSASSAIRWVSESRRRRTSRWPSCRRCCRVAASRSGSVRCGGSLTAAVIIAVGAAMVLDRFQKPASVAFSTSAARL